MTLSAALVSFNAFVQREGIGRRLRKDFGHLKTGRGVVYPMQAQMRLFSKIIVGVAPVNSRTSRTRRPRIS